MEKIDPNAPPEQKFCSRDCRTGQGPKDCKKCKKLNKVKASPPVIPDALIPEFERGEKIMAVCRKIKSAMAILEDLKIPLSFVSILKVLKKEIPAEVCGCSQDATCEDCKGRGWLTADQAQRRKERVNF